MRLAIVAAMCGVGLALPAAIAVSLANEPNAAHAIAEKFAAASTDAEKKKDAEAKARLEAEKKAAEAKAKADAKKREAARKAAEAKRRSVDAERRAAQLKADEADMLARARAEADERKAELEKAQAELARAEQVRDDLEQQARLDEKNRLERAAEEKRLAAEQKSEAERVAKEREAAEVARVAAEAEAERARKVAEAERLAKEAKDAQQALAAKAAEEARLAAARKADEDRQAEIERIARETKAAAEAQRVAAAEKAEAEAKRVAAAEKAEAEAKAEAQRREEAERDAQSKRVADRWRERAEKLGTPPVGPAVSAASTETAPPPAVASKPIDKPASTTVNAAETPGTRATILIVMQAGDKGIRRWEKTADPMLCLGDDCYISAGAGQASERLTRAVAFGPGVALGKRAGACRHSLGCVFRDIDLGGAQARLEPIDLRVLRHDRRETSDIRIDRTCALTSGRLTCGEPVRSATYVAWIVPEAVAAKAGADMLEAIVGAGLPSASAQLDRDPMER